MGRKQTIALEERVDRRSLAQSLRRLRRRPGEAPIEMIEWIYHVLPESPGVIRMYVDGLLERGDVSAAEAVISHAMLLRPQDPALALRKARGLMAQGKSLEAARALRGAQRMRPHHVEVVLLAAEICLSRNHARRAVMFLQRAERGERTRPAVIERLVEAQIRLGETQRARENLQRLPAPNALLNAEVTIAEGRILDAIEHLEASLACSEDAAQRDAMLAVLIGLVRRHGPLERIADVLARLRPEDRRATTAAGEALLSIGAFGEAVRQMSAAAQQHTGRREALHIMVVAASLGGQERAAREALRELQGSEAGVRPHRMARLWRLGLLGRLLRQQECSSRAVGADPSCRLLMPLVSDASRALESVLRQRSLSASERSELTRHRATCLEALSSEAELRRAA